MWDTKKSFKCIRDTHWLLVLFWIHAWEVWFRSRMEVCHILKTHHNINMALLFWCWYFISQVRHEYRISQYKFDCVNIDFICIWNRFDEKCVLRFCSFNVFVLCVNVLVFIPFHVVVVDYLGSISYIMYKNCIGDWINSFYMALIVSLCMCLCVYICMHVICIWLRVCVIGVNTVCCCKPL